MKIVIPGGTGHVGTLLTRHFRQAGHQVVVLSRNVEAQAVLWDGKTLGAWAKELDGADVVINLAGRSVHTRYSAAKKAEIIQSRVDSTRVVGEAIAQAEHPPRMWLQASTATIYAHSYDRANDEHTGVIGGHEPDVPEAWHFSIEVAQAWEKALDEAKTPWTRKVKMRSAVIMSADRGGAFDALLRHIRLGFGRFGDGRQYMSWIHEEDFIRAVEWLIEQKFEGAVILAAPNPLPNAQFMEELREAWGGRPTVPTWRPMLEIGAFLMRTEPELVLKSRRVVPARLLESGFRFEYERWNEAARDLCSRRRGGAGRIW
jgi:uncharacterized protein (TIGR01777 family)